jgi:hypothetical protein
LFFEKSNCFWAASTSALRLPAMDAPRVWLNPRIFVPRPKPVD